MRRFMALMLAALATPTALVADDSDAAAERIHRSTEGFSRTVEERGAATTEALKEQRTLAADVATKPRSVALGTVSGNAWLYDADAVLYDDFDDDGYFRFLSVRFDADTYYESMYVYAMLFLSADGETWEHYYTTDDFLIGGTVPDDEYFVETELLEGYPPGLYDVLVEIYDADFGTFEDEFGPAETSALSLLPIEDATFDRPPVQVAVSTEGGGGAMSFSILPLLLGIGFVAHGRRARRSLTAPGNELCSAGLETRPRTRAHGTAAVG